MLCRFHCSVDIQDFMCSHFASPPRTSFSGSCTESWLLVSALSVCCLNIVVYFECLKDIYAGKEFWANNVDFLPSHSFPSSVFFLIFLFGSSPSFFLHIRHRDQIHSPFFYEPIFLLIHFLHWSSLSPTTLAWDSLLSSLTATQLQPTAIRDPLDQFHRGLPIPLVSCCHQP